MDMGDGGDDDQVKAPIAGGGNPNDNGDDKDQ